MISIYFARQVMTELSIQGTRKLTYFVPVITATVVLTVLSWSGLKVQANLEQEAINRALAAIETEVNHTASQMSEQFDITERSSALYAETLSTIDKQLTATSVAFYARQFDLHFERDNSGVWRNPKANFNPDRQCGTLIPPSTPLNDEIKAWFELACEMSALYGLGTKDKPFISTYVMPFSNGITMYWPSEPDYIYSADASYNYLDTDWLTLSNEQRNPDAIVQWTPASFDIITQKTLVSAMTPVFFRGQRFASAGHDLPLEQLTTLFDRLRVYEGTLAVLVTDDGNVLVSPTYRDKIVSTKGAFNIAQVSDKSLQQTWQALQQQTSLTRFSNDTDEVFIRAIGKRGWKLIVSVPKAPVLMPIQASFSNLTVIAVLALLFEMVLATILLWWLERRRRGHDLALRAAMHALSELNGKLDSKVQARTLALQNSITELESFNYAVSHDLRAPLRHLQAYLAELRESLAGNVDEESLSYIEKSQKSAERLAVMISDMLTLARIGQDALHIQAVDLNELVDEIKQELSSSYENAHLITRDTLMVVNADKELLRQVLQNLLDNACKYSSKTPAPQISVKQAEVTADRWAIEIIDNGVGFDNAYSDRLFKIFHRLHRQDEFSGVGIGLATSAKIVRLHNGSISAHSQPQVKTVFRIELPHKILPTVNNTLTEF